MDQENRCALLCRKQNPPLIGTMSRRSVQIFIEMAKPWPSPLVFDGLATLVGEAIKAGMQTSLLAFAPVGVDFDPTRVKVIVGRQEQGGMQPFAWQQFQIEQGEVPCLVRSVLGLAAEPIDVARYEMKEPVGRQLFICAHAAHDGCCGTFGGELAQTLALDSELAGVVGVSECSHMGGHRFAPTMIEVPSMACYGFLDAKAAKDIALRRGSADELVLEHYRGFAGLPEKLQCVEALILQSKGWSWLSEQQATIQEDGEKVSVDIGTERMDFVVKAGEPVLAQASCRDSAVKPQRTYLVTWVE